MLNEKTLSFSPFGIKMNHIFTINKPHAIRKSKYQKYFNCFIVWIAVPCAFWFSFQQNIVTILKSAVFRRHHVVAGEYIYIYKNIYVYIYCPERICSSACFAYKFIYLKRLFVLQIFSFQQKKLQKILTGETTNMIAKFLQNKIYINHWQSTFIVNLIC